MFDDPLQSSATAARQSAAEAIQGFLRDQLDAFFFVHGCEARESLPHVLAVAGVSPRRVPQSHRPRVENSNMMCRMS